MTAVHAARIRRFALTAAMLGVAVTSCDNPSSPPAGAGDPENISRVTVALTGNATTRTSSVFDPDGTALPLSPGDPSATLALSKGVTYNGTITLLNDLDANNVINISNEVHAEANFHRFFYTFVVTGSSAACSGISVPIGSLDADTQDPPQPLGLTFQVVVTADAPSTTTCNMHIELHHFEEAKGDGLGSTFDTDLSIEFPMSIS